MNFEGSIIRRYLGLKIALSEKIDGTMKIVDGDSNNADAFANRRIFFNKLGLDGSQVVSAGLVHGSKIARVGPNEAGIIVPNVDVLMTDAPNLYLAITVADCLPIVFYAPKQKAVALIHSGWRSLAAEIISKTVKKMKTEFQVQPGELLVSMGPSICQRHYKVSYDVQKIFSDYDAVDEVGNLNLRQIARSQLLASGLSDGGIEISDDCTYCLSEKYFSYRRDQQKKVEAMLAVAGIKI